MTITFQEIFPGGATSTMEFSNLWKHCYSISHASFNKS